MGSTISKSKTPKVTYVSAATSTPDYDTLLECYRILKNLVKRGDLELKRRDEKYHMVFSPKDNLGSPILVGDENDICDLLKMLRGEI